MASHAVIIGPSPFTRPVEPECLALGPADRGFRIDHPRGTPVWLRSRKPPPALSTETQNSPDVLQLDFVLSNALDPQG